MVRKPIFKRALRKLENILSDCLISYTLGRVVQYEKFMQRATRCIDIIKKTAYGAEGDKAMIEAYEVYGRLQRLSHYPQYFSDSTRKKPDRVVSENRVVYTQARPTQLKWDAAAMMAVPTAGSDRNWWRPPPRPPQVKTFTQQEIEDA